MAAWTTCQKSHGALVADGRCWIGCISSRQSGNRKSSPNSNSRSEVVKIKNPLWYRVVAPLKRSHHSFYWKVLLFVKWLYIIEENKEMGETKVQGCEEKERVLLLWERALTLFYENDTELFVAGAQERTIAGKIAMYMDRVYPKFFQMSGLVIDIEYNRSGENRKPNNLSIK